MQTILLLAAKILEQCTKVGEGKSILLTKMQCHWLDYTFWWCNLHPPFDPCHSDCDKYRRRGATFAKWYQSMDKYIKLIKDEIACPSFIPLPSDEESEEVWKRISNREIDIFRRVNYHKELEFRHMRVSMQLSIDQRKWLKNILPGYIKDGRLDIGILSGYIYLKLINNIIRILSTTPKKSVVLFDLYTLDILKAIFEDFKKNEASVLKDITDCRREGKQFYEGVDINQFLEDFNRDLEMMNIFTEMLQEDVLPQIKNHYVIDVLMIGYRWVVKAKLPEDN